MEILYDARKMIREFTEENINRAIEVLSTPVNKQSFTANMIMKEVEKQYLRLDVMDGKYKRKTKEDYERMRVDALEKANGIVDQAKRVHFLIETAEEIEEGIRMLEYNDMYRICCQTVCTMEITKNMLADGVSLTKICEYIPSADIYDVFICATKHWGIEIVVSDEEQKAINKAMEKATKGITFADIWKKVGKLK